MHVKQRAYILDDAPINTAVCGRRGGKTTAGVGRLLVGGLRAPDAFSCYIGLTGKGAKKLVWPELVKMNARYGIGGVPNIADQTLILPNGHTIFLGGCETRGEMEKYRSYKYKNVVVDESGSQGPWLRELVVDIVEPACVDVNGLISLIGSPAVVCDGYFYDLSANPESDERVSTHHWTCLDNPFIPGARAWLDRKIKDRKWDPDDPTLLREWYGQWVPDTNKLCFSRFKADINGWDGVLPSLYGQSRWEHVLSIDIGYDDPTSFTLIADARTSDTAYVCSSYKEAHMELSAIFARAREICANKRVRRIVVDASGGGGKNIVADWSKRFNVPVHFPPDKNVKNAKKDHIALCNNAFADRKLMVNVAACGDLIHEINTVCWDDKRKNPDPRYPNDCVDGLEYGYMSSYHYANVKTEKPKSQLTTEERYAREEEELELREVQRIRNQQRADRRSRMVF